MLDLRREPTPATGALDHDPLQETQLLYGELVLVHEHRGGWARIEAVEQPEWTHHEQWEGYPGWVEARGLVEDDPTWVPTLVITDAVALVHRRPLPDSVAFLKLSMGTRLSIIEAREEWWQIRLLDNQEGWIYRPQGALLPELEALPTAARRAKIVEAAQRLLGTPYYWGGRSAKLPGYRTPPHGAVDCSGLTNLCYRAAGLSIPRDAHEQFLRATPISLEAVQAGDLIFLSDPDDPKRINHVMLVAGEGRLIEGPGTGGRVHEVALKPRPQKTAAEGRRVNCGTYFE